MAETRAEAKLYSEFEVLQAMEFKDKAERYSEIKETIEALEKEKKQLANDLESALIVADQARVKLDERWVFERARGTNVLISGKRLAELGVPAETIAEATIRTPYTYVQAIDLEKKKKKSEGEEGAKTE